MDEAPKDYYSAEEATRRLGIRKETLYAYVSRGLVRSVGNGRARERMYLREDLDRLQLRSRVRSGQEAVAASAMNLGHPIVPTGITEITPEGPRYRGRLATDLVRQRVSFERAAELLWSGMLHEGEVCWSPCRTPPALSKALRAIRGDIAQCQLTEIFALVTMHLAIGRGPLQERLLAGRTFEATREMVLTLAGCFGLIGSKARFAPVPANHSVSQALLRAMGRRAEASDMELVDASLVLLADHELSPGTLAARVAASGGSAIHSCVAAAMAASSGTEVARLYDRVDAFLGNHLRRSAMVREATRLLAAGQQVPGFEHPLYPNGDPRAALLLQLITQRVAQTPRMRETLAFIAQMRDVHGLHARHELALVVACKAMELPPQAPAALFVLARVSGWVAHVVEQRLSSSLIRPRAKFIAQPAGAAGG